MISFIFYQVLKTVKEVLFLFFTYKVLKTLQEVLGRMQQSSLFNECANLSVYYFAA